MTFKSTKTLVNNDSDVRVDVESLARIEISDVEHILEISKNSDPRTTKILYESALTKCATAFQLSMRACEYLNKKSYIKKLHKKYPKDSKKGVGLIGRARAELFHNGIGFYHKEVIYPFGKIKGRGYLAIKVKRNASLNIRGYTKLTSKDKEYAITSEGIYEIHNPLTKEEKWIQRNDLLSITATDDRKVRQILEDGVKDLKHIWQEVSKFRYKLGCEIITYKNEGGSWELLEKNHTTRQKIGW